MLSERYPLVENRLTIAGKSWKITSVTDQDALADRIRTEEDLQNFPYGLMLWASAIGLSEWLATKMAHIHSRQVLEIGAGIGLAGMVAASLGASVTQTDFLEDALALCQQNASSNGITNIEIRHGDWRNWPDDISPVPVVIGADILYDREVHPVLEHVLPRLVTSGGTVYIADPLRPQALDFVERLERSGRWSLKMEAIRITFDGQPKDLAIFELTYCA